jgi:hypothetical protein
VGIGASARAQSAAPPYVGDGRAVAASSEAGFAAQPQAGSVRSAIQRFEAQGTGITDGKAAGGAGKGDSAGGGGHYREIRSAALDVLAALKIRRRSVQQKS